MIHLEPGKRISARSALQHPYFDGFEPDFMEWLKHHFLPIALPDLTQELIKDTNKHNLITEHGLATLNINVQGVIRKCIPFN